MEKRTRITIRGAVQGVGFRPFVYRAAVANGLCGWIFNDPGGVTIEVEGDISAVDGMLEELQASKPVHSYYEYFGVETLDPEGYTSFKILESDHQGDKKVLMQPDLATCPDCLEEVFDPDNHRYLYPFTNCTHCGPRYSIITGLPYDRQQTTMKDFLMCDKCRQEYEDPENRRFHAQPNACPDCGPQVEFREAAGKTLAHRHEAMEKAAEAVKKGLIVALKGLGGFQLIVDAGNEEAVSRLRERKQREEKPFALMVPTLEQGSELCVISGEEEKLLQSSQAPIVILDRINSTENAVAPSVAPGNPTLGIMLPYTPLHHILMRLIDRPVVATSGNLSDEPICTDENEALERMGGIADVYLVHNRPIERHVDDSVVRVIAGQSSVLRRARGYAPFPIPVDIPKRGDNENVDSEELPTILSLGGHLKNSIAVNRGTNMFISQHIGDLDTYEATRAYHKVIKDLPAIYDLIPEWIIHDDHPGYYSSKDSQKRDLPALSIQHHYAHVLSCMAEYGLEGPLLGVAWDGTGYGTDSMIWGGEFLLADRNNWNRVATFRNFMLPGGDKAIREPRRSALGLLFEMLGTDVFDRTDLAPVRSFAKEELDILRKMLTKGINTHTTTSIGRIFDAVASLLDIHQKISFEGQAAMALEHLVTSTDISEYYDYFLNNENGCWVIDWSPTFNQIIDDIQNTEPTVISTKFHNTLSDIIVEVAIRVGRNSVVLSGGCFQNVYLTGQTVLKLKEAGFEPYWHQQIPTNDGGIAAGQLFYALNNINQQKKEPIHHEVPG